MVLLDLEEIYIFTKWLPENYLKANPQKYAILSTNNQQSNSKYKKLLGIT